MNELINIAAFRLAAKKRLPRFVWDAIEGGAGDENTLRENSRAFQEFVFRPRALVDVTERSLKTMVLGQPVSMPLMLAPVGAGRLIHGQAELIAARAAAAAGTIYALSSVTRTPEEVAAVTDGPLWFQLYILGDRADTEALVRRAHASGYVALCVTIDSSIGALRDRDTRNRMKPPVKLRPGLVAQAMTHPRWSADFVRSGGGTSFRSRWMNGGRQQTGIREVERAIQSIWRPVTLDYLAWLRDIWPGRLVVKGIMRADECPKMADLGVDGIVVSNHGGRQLDGLPSTIEVLPEVVAAVGDRVEVMLDGGVRRGADVVKALALGARAVLVGRPYLYGLAVSGSAGVSAVLEIFRAEIDNAIALLGCQSVPGIEPSMLRTRYVSRFPALAEVSGMGDVRSESGRGG
jgi:isopentenyl diphosphate isomerase/L-lactate dehydrogenase-like FMN-dependent dehydrogenase